MKLLSTQLLCLVASLGVACMKAPVRAPHGDAVVGMDAVTVDDVVFDDGPPSLDDVSDTVLGDSGRDTDLSPAEVADDDASTTDLANPDALPVDGGIDALSADTALEDTALPDIPDEVDVPDPDGCPWDVKVESQTALLNVRIYDIWGQEAEGLSSSLWGPLNEEVGLGDPMLEGVPLCDAVQLSLIGAAPLHHSFSGVLDYDGLATADSLSMAGDSKAGAWVVTLNIEGGVPVFTVHVGLAHRYFAASGPTAADGNEITFYSNPADAFEAFYYEAYSHAWKLVTISTWWWESYFELFRDPVLHPYMSEAERFPYTTLGLIQELDAWGVSTKVLVNQFLSQDGFFSGVNIDDELLKAMDKGLVEVMGQFNDASGEFQVEIGEVDLTARLLEAGVLSKGMVIHEVPLQPYLGKVQVDMTELPFGLGAFDLPHASWHQKFFTIDQKVAYIGGLNFQVYDWATGDMKLFEPRRMPFTASKSDRLAVLNKEDEPPYPTRRDYMLRVDGPIVGDAMEIFHERWMDQKAAGVEYSEFATAFGVVEAPAAVPGGVKAQLVTTMPAPYGRYEIMDTLLRAIDQAETYIFIEDQYLRSPILADAIADRLAALPTLVVIAVINPVSEWTDLGCWQTYIELNQLKDVGGSRFQVFHLRSFDWVDTGCILCWDEVAGHFMDTFIHSKLVIIDDLYFQMGSANHNNRGLLYEGEMATVVVDKDWVTAAKHTVLGALLGPTYNPAAKGQAMLNQFEVEALWNEYVYDNWDDEGWDLNLNGAMVPDKYLPEGHIYPLTFGVPGDCLIEGVGADIM